MKFATRVFRNYVLLVYNFRTPRKNIFVEAFNSIGKIDILCVFSKWSCWTSLSGNIERFNPFEHFRFGMFTYLLSITFYTYFILLTMKLIIIFFSDCFMLLTYSSDLCGSISAVCYVRVTNSWFRKDIAESIRFVFQQRII